MAHFSGFPSPTTPFGWQYTSESASLVSESGIDSFQTGGVALGPGFLNIEKTDIILQFLIITIVQLSDRYIVFTRG